MILSSSQQEIINLPGNMIVKANAGTGKTYTMVTKIEKEIEDNHSHKVMAAITFTIKAANEIKNRLNIDLSNHFIGTNNSFAIEEVIRPFAKDVFGNEYDIDMDTDYSVKFYSFENGMKILKEKKILGAYAKSKNNFIFELALNIIKNSFACRVYLKSKYYKLYVDEYQDCDKDMHDFFMYICKNLRIEIFVVGDEKQSIYMWRGAHPEAFNSIWEMTDFTRKTLRDNFRSSQQIQNYSNLLCQETRELYIPVEDLSSIFLVCTHKTSWAKDVLPYIDRTKKLALLRYSNENAKQGARELSDQGVSVMYIPQTPISDITTETAWFYNEIAKYFIKQPYSAYDFFAEIPNAIKDNKTTIEYIKKALMELSESVKHNDFAGFEKCVGQFADYLGYSVRSEHCKKLYCTITDDTFYPAFSVDELNNIAITFHSSKGLEFDQFIIFASDYTLSGEAEIYNHYVAATRAKSRLIIVYNAEDDMAKRFAQNINRILEAVRVGRE